MPTPSPLPARPRVALIGRGRLGHALAGALARAETDVEGPLGRGAAPLRADVVLLCVPDAEIAAAARRIAPGPLVGHCSGASTLAVLGGHDAFSLHPLMTVPASGGASFAGATAAVAGATPRGLAAAEELARRLGLVGVRVADEDRAAYHAAAALASNALVALEDAAARLAATAGLDRAALAPLVRASVENWLRDGAAALTGPVARGDEETVERHREAVRERAPELLGAWEELVSLTRETARA